MIWGFRTGQIVADLRAYNCQTGLGQGGQGSAIFFLYVLRRHTRVRRTHASNAPAPARHTGE
jgi:hypothetical protein